MLIDRADAQAIMDYLKTRPWGEVYQLAPILLRLKPLEQTEEKEATSGESLHE